MAAFCDNADARRRHKAQAAESYQPSYSSIVVDINSGEVMQATNADAPRHPASLTKIMTLYLLFERLEQGKIKLQTELPVSAHAAVQAPSKLGLKPGETIRVETAIRAIVTKSANDVAVIVAEALGGDEPSFAKMMTAKARSLGMAQTTYRNASALVIKPRSAVQSRTDFQITIITLPRGLSTTAANRSETTIICSAPSMASMASRRAISAIPGSTSSRRFAAPIATSWRLYSAAARPAPAMRASAA
jgi:D-alanyl-D-alanine carboxypeptidase